MSKSCALGRSALKITGGFWRERQDVMRKTTQHAIYDRFHETGRFAALSCQWREGMQKPHIFWDSDIAKWIEGAAYLLMDGRDAQIELIIDEVADNIEAHRMADGYFNSYYIAMEPENRFTHYHNHELYCLGHLIEAAVAYHQATGKRKLLDLMIDYVDLVDRVFRVEGSAKFATPGHEEIELALYRLYRHTDDRRFLTLMRYFIDARGVSEKDFAFDTEGRRNLYTQGNLPARQLRTADGHSVRAMYLYCAMADLGLEDADEALLDACRALFDNVTTRRMYVTGGIGSTRVGEAFSFDYDLMNRAAYAETCAALGLALFGRRLSRAERDGRYADAAELALYNGMLAGISIAGDSFFYENPLEVHPEINRHFGYQGYSVTERQKVFSCSCCPPNLLRLISSVQEFAYTQSSDTLFVHHYMQCEGETAFGRVIQETQYPYDGEIRLRLPAGAYTLALRIPGWAGDVSICVNGQEEAPEVRNGYADLRRDWREGDEVTLSLPMEVRFLQAHPALHEDCGRTAIARGPLVYCAEQADNGPLIKDLALRRGGNYEIEPDGALGVPVIKTIGTKRRIEEDAPLYSGRPATRGEVEVTLIPYFAWCNRGEGEMSVWLLEA